MILLICVVSQCINTPVRPSVKPSECWSLFCADLFKPVYSDIVQDTLISHSEIYKPLKAEEIPISLSAMKRIGQCFETTGNIVRKKGSGMPKASSCRDDHLLKYKVLKDRKRRQQKLSAEFKISENKTLSRRTITRRLCNAGFVSRRCAIAVSEKHQRQN